MTFDLVLMMILGVMSATFSGAEAALFTMSGHKQEDQSLIAKSLLRRPSTALTVILFGNLVVNLLYFSAAVRWAHEFSGSYFAVLSLATLLVFVICCEITPKILGQRFPGFASRLLLPPVWLVYLALGPCVEWVSQRPFLLRWKAARQPQEKPLESGGIDAMLRENEAWFSTEERELLRGILEFGTLRAGELRRSLADSLRLSERMPLEDAKERMLAEGVAWAAVIDHSGEVSGYLDLTRSPQGTLVGEVMQPVPILPEGARVGHGILLLLKKNAPFLLLVDEYGNSAGIIERGRWAETLLDQLPKQPEGRLPAIVPLGQNRFQVDATLPLHVFRERFGDPGAADVRVDTLGGLVQERLGRVPEVGDRLRLGGFQTGFHVIVTRCEGNRPLEVEVQQLSGNDGTPYSHPRAGSE